ncbi:YfhO family protein [candidate division KSB1 bacterium]|nr:YfhO family protein [candidate division KSB1 bacterium]
MAKKKKQKRPQTPVKLAKENSFKKYPVLTTLVVAFLLLTIFYFPILFQGKTFLSPDKMTSQAFNPFVKDAFSKDIFPLWCPYIFSGMPSYASLLRAPRVNIIDSPVKSVLKIFRPLVHDTNFLFLFLNYLIFAVLMYLLMRNHKVSPIAALFAGIAVIFMPQFIAFTAFNHNTKFLSLVLIPLIYLLTIRLFERRNILYFCLTSLAIGFQLIRAHVQVCYYTYLMLGIFLVFKVISDYRTSKKPGDIFVPAALLLGVVLTGALLSSVIYIPVFEYQQYSIRGSTVGGGLDYNYATGWSFHPLEMVTFLIPSFMGFGGETYWGKMNFTDYPLYFSILVLLLAGAAFVLKRDRVTWFFGITAIFSLLVSFGRHLPLLYAPMFKFLPFFNKFRIPSMIHILLDISLVVLAGYGLDALIEYQKNKKTEQKSNNKEKNLSLYLYIFLGVIGVFVLFILFAKPVMLDMMAGGSSNFNVNLREYAYKMAFWDSLKALLFVGLGLLLIFLFLKKEISGQVFGVSFIILVVIDLWFVDYKIIHPQPAVDEKTYFTESPAVKFIKQDKSLFRILPVRDDKGANWYMYHFIQNVNGYSAAKLRIYQEFLEETIYGGALSNTILNMMNVKYLLSLGSPIPDPNYTIAYNYKVLYRGQRLDAFVYQNKNVLPRAFFADSTVVLTGRKSIFDRMNRETFNPQKEAILEEYPPFSVFPADSNKVEVTSYGIHNIKIKATADKAALLVLSEVYYPAGWKAFVDGVETKIYKTNYILRSIFLEPGEHEIEFVFDSSSFRLGVWISIVTLAVLLLLLGSTFYIQYRRKASGAV